MNKTAHTPGPWKADFGEAFHVKEQDGGRIAMMIFTAGRFGSKGRRNPDEVTANARLIAAAPCLLEALEDARDTILELINRRGSECEGRDEDWVADIDAAIARAKGKA